jgi:pimeloyl-ACP methyl ester carboxylesterase
MSIAGIVQWLFERHATVRRQAMHSSTIETHGLRLGFLAAGGPARPGLLLLHGWPQSSRVYDLVIDELGQDHFVLAVDLPAIGMSRGLPPSAEKTVLADIVLAGAERAGARSLVVAGFDVGGMVAFAAARDHADRIRGAIVMNTVVPGIEPWEALLADPRIWHFAFHSLPDLPETLVTGHQREYFDFFHDALAGNRSALTERHRAAFAQAYERPESLKAGFDWYRAMQSDARQNAQHQSIETPMQYLRGDADGRSPDDYVAGLRKTGARNIRGAAIEGSGECTPLEAPCGFIDAVRRFCRSLPAD